MRGFLYGWCKQHPQTPVEILGRKKERGCQSGEMVDIRVLSDCRRCRQAGNRVDAAWLVPANEIEEPANR
jgi:hypothetical protein